MNGVFVCVLLCACAVVAMPSPQQKREDGEGGWVVKTDRNRNGGTDVRAEANRKWDVTRDGKIQAEVHGHWERTYGGRNHGDRDHGVGASVGGSWRK